MYGRLTAGTRYALALGVMTAASVALLLLDAFATRRFVYTYMVWNLLLAWIPFLLSLCLTRMLQYRLWSSWPALGLSAAWIVFLPNSFYMVSDFIHLADATSASIMFDTVVLTSFILLGLVLGASSLYAVHRALLHRLSDRNAVAIIIAVLILSSVAIYIGRDLRWNSWDLLFNPAGVAFDVSERLLHPSQYGQVIGIVGPFFVLLTCLYLVVWEGAQLLRQNNS